MAGNEASDEKEVLVKIRNLVVNYRTRLGLLNAISDISFDIYKGEILGLVGESGCGKSTLGKALMRMLPDSADVDGQVLFDGRDVLKMSHRELRDFRGRQVSMIFQDPMTSLNPVQKIRDHLLETIDVHEPEMNERAALDRIRDLVERLGVQKERLPDYPHQLSGGMRQRVMISLGLVLNADLVVADEATTSLDVIVEAKLMDQLREIRDEFGVTIIVITHNIALVAELADRIAVMYAGRLAELGSIYDVFDNPLHPYTRGLLRSVPNISLDDTEDLYRMGGEPPNLTNPPPGCRFHPRCPEAMPICSQTRPSFQEAASGRYVHCWLYQDHPEKEAPTVEVTT